MHRRSCVAEVAGSCWGPAPPGCLRRWFGRVISRLEPPGVPVCDCGMVCAECGCVYLAHWKACGAREGKGTVPAAVPAIAWRECARAGWLPPGLTGSWGLPVASPGGVACSDLPGFAVEGCRQPDVSACALWHARCRPEAGSRRRHHATAVAAGVRSLHLLPAPALSCRRDAVSLQRHARTLACMLRMVYNSRHRSRVPGGAAVRRPWARVQVVPDIRERTELEMIGTPLTHARYLRRHRGTYGPGISAREATFPGPVTPIPGLYGCGDSYMPGIGVPAAAASGMIAANTLVSVPAHFKMLAELQV